MGTNLSLVQGDHLHGSWKVRRPTQKSQGNRNQKESVALQAMHAEVVKRQL